MAQVRKAKQIKIRAPRTHISKIIKPVQVLPNKRMILPGMIIWFSYTEKDITDPEPIILALWLDYKGRKGGSNLLHGINLNYLRSGEIKGLFSILESRFDVSVVEDEPGGLTDIPYTRVALPGDFNKRPTAADKQKLKIALYERSLKDKFGYLGISFRSYKLKKMKNIRLVNFKYK
tara:strand:+ start:629 stop:1156 length:528 start_codon:yes stop_codon:yes gene_type:complete